MTRHTILFHSTNTIGVGHMARSSAIAVALRERHTNEITPFMVVEGADHGLFKHHGLPFLRFPDRRFIDEGLSDGPCSRSDREKALSLMCQAIVNSLQPRAACFDLFPSPYFVSTIESLGVPYCVCLRTGKLSQLHDYFARNRKMLDNASTLIVPHEAGCFAVPDRWQSKVHYVGQINRAFTLHTNETVQNEILITGGGGGFPGTVHFYNLAIRAFRQCRKRRPALTALLITGPLFAEWSSLELAEGVRVVPSRWDLPQCASRASLVICQAGYNTLGELLRIGCPAITIPARRGFDDQFMRAESVARSHPQVRAFLDDNPDSLANLISSILSASLPWSPSPTKDFHGAETAADILARTAKGSTQ